MKCFLVASALVLSLSLLTRAQEAPTGWKTQQRAGGATTYTPSDLRAGETYSVTTFESAPLGGQTPEAYLRSFAGVVGTRAGQLSAPLRVESKGTVTSGTGAYFGPNGAKLGAFFLVFTRKGGSNIAISRTLYSRGELMKRYQPETVALSNALIARAAQPSAPRPDLRATVAPSTSKTTGPLRPANLGGAKVFVKYYWTSYPTLTINIGHLLLFPDGSAFDAIPTKPLASWSAAEIRKSVPRFDVGRWKMAGNKMILTFPQRQRDTQRTLTRNARGWNDPSEMEMNGENYNIYFPITAPPRARLLGAWDNEELVTAGTMGGAAPLVAGGSSNGLVLGADGTFTGNSRSFFSATTSNMGDAYKGEGNVTTTGKNRRQSAGKWRLDGPLLTLEKDGERTVHLAFLMPYWSKSAANTDLMIDDDRWKRPKK